MFYANLMVLDTSMGKILIITDLEMYVVKMKKNLDKNP